LQVTSVCLAAHDKSNLAGGVGVWRDLTVHLIIALILCYTAGEFR